MLLWAFTDLPCACRQGSRLFILINLFIFLIAPSWGFYSLSEIPRESLAPAVMQEHAGLPRHRGGVAGPGMGREIPGCCLGSAGRKCLWARRRRQRKPPAAGSHAEIRQSFICSTPACLEKYVINALKRSFNRVLRFFWFYFIFALA